MDKVNVKSKNITATGYITGSDSATRPTRIFGVYYLADTTAGSITFKNGTSGATVLKVDTPLGSATAGEATAYQVEVPGDGLYCSTNAHATLAGIDMITVFYQ